MGKNVLLLAGEFSARKRWSLPRRFHGMLQDALRSYGGDEELESDTEAALDFAEYMEAMCELILKNEC